MRLPYEPYMAVRRVRASRRSVRAERGGTRVLLRTARKVLLSFQQHVARRVAPRNCRAVFFFLHETTTRAMASALGASAAFRPGTRAAHVFLERNPYVAWEAQRPAFAQPAFTGVVHPAAALGRPRSSTTRTRLADHPAEPRVRRARGSRASRASGRWRRARFPTHVQTVSASWCRDVDDARAMMRVAADAGASALLCVTGDGVRGRRTTWTRSRFCEPRALRDAGEIESDVRLACAANPCLEALRLRTRRVSPSGAAASAKIEEAPTRSSAALRGAFARALWRLEIQASGWRAT